MSDKSLRLQILEYLIANNGIEDFVDIKNPFLNPSSDINERSKYISVIDQLLKDEHIDMGDKGYGIMGCFDAGKLRPIDYIKVNARLTPIGEIYIQGRNKQQIPTISAGNVHIGDNFGNYNQSLGSRATNFKQNIKPKQYPSTKSKVPSVIEKYWWAFAVPIIVIIIGLYIEKYYF